MVSCKICKSEMKLEHGSFTHIFFKKAITIHNVPHYVCEECDRRFYVSEKTVESKLIEAYQKNKLEYDYNE